jgi:predicted nuclease of predicted toxin-antitoxin system
MKNVVADESVDYRIIIELRKTNYEVYSIAEQQPSLTDSNVLALANERQALLLTEDKDFGELAFRFKFPHRGILLIRIDKPTEKISITVEIINKYYDNLIDKFSVLTEDKLRIKD